MFTARKGDTAKEAHSRSTVVGLKEDIQEVAHKAGQKARGIYDAATHEARDATVVVEKQIRTHPVAASAIAAGVGFLLGALFRRRH